MTIRKSTSTVRSVEVEIDDETGNVIRETWKDSAGNFDRLGDLPAVTTYCHLTGEVIEQYWYREHKLHREGDKPAIRKFYPETGKEASRAYYVDDKTHRTGNRPAVIGYDKDGSVNREFYSVSGVRHRTDGPAIFNTNYMGQGPRKEYWVDGQQVDPP